MVWSCTCATQQASTYRQVHICWVVVLGIGFATPPSVTGRCRALYQHVCCVCQCFTTATRRTPFRALPWEPFLYFSSTVTGMVYPLVGVDWHVEHISRHGICSTAHLCKHWLLLATDVWPLCPACTAVTGVPLLFAEVEEAVRLTRQTAIGYIRSNSTGQHSVTPSSKCNKASKMQQQRKTVLGPSASHTVTFNEGDRIVVLAQDYAAAALT